MSGSGKPEGTAIFKRVSEEAYKPDPAREVEGFKLFTSTPTLKFYENGPDVLVGIRGTKDFADAKADAAIPFGALENTQRFKADLATLQQVKAAHPDKTFYGAGHSLGAAILDLFISKGLIQSGKSFNGALQLGKEQSANERTYNSGDPLYMLSKPFLKQAPQVQTKAPSLLGRLSGAYNLYEQHKISGGAKRDREPTPEEIAEAEARADRRRRTDRADAHFGGIEQQLNELSQRMFRKRAEDLDDEENEQLDEAFQRLQGHHEDESDEEEEEDDGRTERIFGKKGRRGRRRARQFMQHLKFPARLAQYNATLKFQKRKYNKALRDQRADSDYDVPSGEDFTEFEYSDDGEEEPPKFEPGHNFKRGGAKRGGAKPEEKRAFQAKLLPLLEKFRADLRQYYESQRNSWDMMEELKAARDNKDEEAAAALATRLIPMLQAEVAAYPSQEKTFDEITRLITDTPNNVADEASYEIKMYNDRDGVDLADIVRKINEARRMHEVRRNLLMSMRGGPDVAVEPVERFPTAEERLNAMLTPEYQKKVRLANRGVMNPEEPYDYRL
jgi:hypothetical protein